MLGPRDQSLIVSKPNSLSTSKQRYGSQRSLTRVFAPKAKTGISEMKDSTEISSTELRREAAVQVEISISHSTPTMTTEYRSSGDECKRKRDCVEDSARDPDRKLKTALLSWLNNKIFDDQDQHEITPELSYQTTDTRDVKITVQLDTPRRKRTSRYLCERDRWEIIKRIEGGEQQVTLAKEFSVSRAAVCNLYKNRREILARAANDPKATHPKKSHKTKASSMQLQSTSSVSPTDKEEAAFPPNLPGDMGQEDLDRFQLRYSHNDDSSSMSGTEDETTTSNQYRIHASDQRDPIQGMMQELTVSLPFQVHEASARSRHCMNLVATLRDKNISTSMFQQRSARLAQLLIEEALACLPHDTVDVTNQYGDICRVTKTLDERDICGVSMEGRGTVLLRAFSNISPASPVGIVSVDSENIGDCECLPSVKAHIPIVRPEQVVLLFDIQCATGNEACAVLHHLIHEKQVAADQIYFVTLISSLEGLQKVSRGFPGVTLVTAQMDTVLDEQQRIRPGIGDFMQRFWNIGANESIV